MTTLEQEFWTFESGMAERGEGLTKEQQIGVSIVFEWLNTRKADDPAKAVDDVDDGGPAFPSLRVRDDPEAPLVTVGGISTRLYLAAKFAAAWVSAFNSSTSSKTHNESFLTEANRLGLAQADELLERIKWPH